MMMIFNTPSIAEAQPYDGLSDRSFFKQFPKATHRTRPWRSRDESDKSTAARVATEKGWITVARRDGFRARMREHTFPFLPFPVPEFVILQQPRKGAGLTIDYSPIGFGVRDWS